MVARPNNSHIAQVFSIIVLEVSRETLTLIAYSPDSNIDKLNIPKRMGKASCVRHWQFIESNSL